MRSISLANKLTCLNHLNNRFFSCCSNPSQNHHQTSLLLKLGEIFFPSQTFYSTQNSIKTQAELIERIKRKKQITKTKLQLHQQQQQQQNDQHVKNQPEHSTAQRVGNRTNGRVKSPRANNIQSNPIERPSYRDVTNRRDELTNDNDRRPKSSPHDVVSQERLLHRLEKDYLRNVIELFIKIFITSFSFFFLITKTNNLIRKSQTCQRAI